MSLSIDQIAGILDSIESKINACYNCISYEGGLPDWLGPHVRIFELLKELGLQDEEESQVSENLKCPICETRLNSQDEVEVKAKDDPEVAKIRKIIFNFIQPEVREEIESFSSFLSNYPYLGLAHPVGRKLFDSIKKASRQNIDSQIWYRARRLNDERRLFKSSEMGAPDPNKCQILEGRYNHTGQSVLYLSSDKETAFSELKLKNENLCAVQKFRIRELRDVLKLRYAYKTMDSNIDTLFLGIIYDGYIGQSPDQNNSWKPKYFVPRFITDCLRNLHYNGIVFSSAESRGENLVVFDPSSKKIVAEGNPEVFMKNNGLKF
jgi:hypothetical protein